MMSKIAVVQRVMMAPVRVWLLQPYSSGWTGAARKEFGEAVKVALARYAGKSAIEP
jgi:hypothetical protein